MNANSFRLERLTAELISKRDTLRKQLDAKDGTAIPDRFGRARFLATGAARMELQSQHDYFQGLVDIAIGEPTESQRES